MEVRIKLHVNYDLNVQNIWMSLNYEKNPTVKHLINQITKNFQLDSKKSAVKLYLDEYWLPPWENSQLLRENDSVKVIIENTHDVMEEKIVEDEAPFSFNTTKQQQQPFINYNNNNNEVETNKKLNKTNNFNFYAKKQNNLNNSIENNTKNNVNNQNIFTFGSQNQENTKAAHKEIKKPTTTTLKPTTQNSNHNDFKLNKLNSNKSKSNATNKNKFSVANFVHLLNETNNNNVEKEETYWDEDNNAAVGEYDYEQEQQQDEYYDEFPEEQEYNSNHKKINCNKSNNNDTTYTKKDNVFAKPQIPTAGTKKQESKMTITQLDRIVQNINSHGKNKWKNSTNQTTSKLPKHIIFESSENSSNNSSSSSSSSSDSDSDSDSSSTSSASNEKVTKKALVNRTNKNSNQETTTAEALVQQKKKNQLSQNGTTTNQWKRKTKEEQLNMVSYNRSYVIQNSGSINEFKKAFNATKYNSPYTKQNEEYNEEESNEHRTGGGLMKTSTENELVIVNAKPKYDFEKLEPLIGSPKINDKIAFQVLELSNDFTPEISDYKIGTVIDFNLHENTITLQLDGSYNEVLNKSNKFTVVEDDDEAVAAEKGEEEEENDSGEMDKQAEKDDAVLNENKNFQFEWKNLLNVKILPITQDL